MKEIENMFFIFSTYIIRFCGMFRKGLQLLKYLKWYTKFESRMQDSHSLALPIKFHHLNLLLSLNNFWISKYTPFHRWISIQRKTNRTFSSINDGKATTKFICTKNKRKRLKQKWNVGDKRKTKPNYLKYETEWF